MNHSVLRLRYLDYSPTIAAPASAEAGAVVIGRASLGHSAHFGALAVIRADGHYVTVGDDFWLGPRSTVHIAHELLPTIIGSGVSVGINATVHACRVGDQCVIEDNVVILDGSVVAERCVLAAGSVVFPRSELPSGHWCEGSPAKPLRPITAEQLAAAHARLRGLSLAARIQPMPGEPFSAGESNYVAPSASVQGRVFLADEASVWFGCELRAARHEITVATGSNIQDNTIIMTDVSPVRIGANVTIGHNVTLQSCEIGANSLIGIGSVLAAGTVVEDDVLVAAGTVTLPGQRLGAGSMWAGRPARRLGALDDAKRHIIAFGAEHYRIYNRDFLRSRSLSPA
jgi:gamma-carbonic anhydrase